MTPEAMVALATNAMIILLMTVLVLILLWLLLTAFVLWYKWKDREEKSLQMITLLVAVPENNEVKIDAMEQIIDHCQLYKGAKFKFCNDLRPNCVSLEIIEQ
jgi:hypothetical protein